MNNNHAIKSKFIKIYKSQIKQYIYIYLYSENNLIKQFRTNLHNDFYYITHIVEEIKFTAIFYKFMIVKIDY